MHQKVSTSDDFGVTEEDLFQPYCKDTYARLPSHSRAACQASYDKKLTATRNPFGFEYVPITRMDSFWSHFVQHVNGAMHKYRHLLRKLKCQDILEMDDSLPVVVQLRGGDKSESHSVCIYDGSIYNSASRFVLVKSRETFNWCCGDYGFEAHVRLYRLHLNLKVKGVEQKKVKAKRTRLG
jgi:hypothetical protein